MAPKALTYGSASRDPSLCEVQKGTWGVALCVISLPPPTCSQQGGLRSRSQRRLWASSPARQKRLESDLLLRG